MHGNSILVTGGAGYIGSHVAKLLGENKENIVVLDNLSKGFKEAVLYGELIVGNTGDKELVSKIMQHYNIDTVMHFAAHTVVPESVSNPLKYYSNNTCNTRNLLEVCQAHNIKHFIFSSTAAVYGMPAGATVSEETPLAPINAYGMSKLMSEWMLRDLAQASKLKYVALRYFNVAGCDPDGKIGQSTPGATLLTKVACEAAVGKRSSVSIFGTDYPTRDGTGIRDYIHVIDLADAHIKALDYLRMDGESTTLNVGYGHGYSVREVLGAVQRVNNTSLNVLEEERRPGDPPVLIANADLIRTTLDWHPQYDDLDFIVKTSLDWEKKLASGMAYG
jgi:UDP-glucose 4-epimerase